MTVFLDHDGRPFYGGTYYPRPTFTELLRAVDAAWRTNRDALADQAERLTEAVQRSAAIGGAGTGIPGPEVLDHAADRLLAAFDGRWGGFGGAPKFPQTLALDFLLGRGDVDQVLTTLDAMASGGIYDHLGGGFARYSVDERWLVPHFEKMLYDQALLARVYLHAWQVTGEPRHLQVVEETIGYVVRDLTDAGGGFHAAEDADSEGEEGRFYVWSLDELRAVGGDVAVAWYGATAGGNFEGANILHRPVRGDLVRPPEVEEARRRLFEHRERRVRPGRDDKVIAEWNGLMISTIAEAAAATGRADWAAAARTAGAAVLATLRPDGRWRRASSSDHPAVAADHAALVDAYTRLTEATGEARWVGVATETAHALLDLFWDDDGGGLFTTGRDAEQLVARQKDVIDGATPSASSVAATALQRLGALTGEARFTAAAELLLAQLGPAPGEHPLAFGQLLQALDLRLTGVTEIAVAGDRPDLLDVVREAWRPRAVVAWGEPHPSPLWEGRREGFAYVCRDYRCEQPVDDVDRLRAQLSAT